VFFFLFSFFLSLFLSLFFLSCLRVTGYAVETVKLHNHVLAVLLVILVVLKRLLLLLLAMATLGAQSARANGRLHRRGRRPPQLKRDTNLQHTQREKKERKKD
jgi:hypothetical protein